MIALALIINSFTLGVLIYVVYEHLQLTRSLVQAGQQYQRAIEFLAGRIDDIDEGIRS